MIARFLWSVLKGLAVVALLGLFTAPHGYILDWWW